MIAIVAIGVAKIPQKVISRIVTCGNCNEKQLESSTPIEIPSYRLIKHALYNINPIGQEYTMNNNS